MNSLNSRRLIIFGVFILTASLVLLYWFRPFIREAIVIPLSYWAWIIGLFLESTPQVFFWVAVLLIGALIAWRSFARKIPRSSYETVEKVPDYPPASGRVSNWANRVELMRMGSYYNTTFNEALGRVALDLISYRYRMNNRQIERGLSQGTLRVPPPVRDFLVNNVFQREYKSVSYFTFLYRAIRLWLHNRIKSPKHFRDALTPEARSLIQYMEEELEVHYDDPGR